MDKKPKNKHAAARSSPPLTFFTAPPCPLSSHRKHIMYIAKAPFHIHARDQGRSYLFSARETNHLILVIYRHSLVHSCLLPSSSCVQPRSEKKSHRTVPYRIIRDKRFLCLFVARASLVGSSRTSSAILARGRGLKTGFLRCARIGKPNASRRATRATERAARTRSFVKEVL